MELTLITVFLGILTAAHVAAAAVLILAALQLRRTAEAVEVVAYQAQDQVARLGEAARRVEGVTGLLGSGWFKAATAAAGVLAALWGARRSRA